MKFINVFNPTNKPFSISGVKLQPQESINVKQYSEADINYMTALRRSGMTVKLVNVADTPHNEIIQEESSCKDCEIKIETLQPETTDATSDTAVVTAEIKEEPITDNSKPVTKEVATKSKSSAAAKSSETEEKQTETKPVTKSTQRKKPGPKPKVATSETTDDASSK